MSGVLYSPSESDQDALKEEIDWWTDVFRDQDVDAIENRGYRRDETPEEREHTIDGFLLSRCPAINAWYRLFDPGHGTRESWYRQEYQKISPDDGTPAIFVSWYDAWVFCLWTRWEDLSCRLPYEDEWEYAAKAGTDPEWNYWWGDDFCEDKCNADRQVGKTTPPSAKHGNPWKLDDMLGNVWEWCEDLYRERYLRDGDTSSSARVLRGGSWGSGRYGVRSAVRDLGLPTGVNYDSGIRVARALARKS